jgi:hypothetical protein
MGSLQQARGPTSSTFGPALCRWSSICASPSRCSLCRCFLGCFMICAVVATFPAHPTASTSLRTLGGNLGRDQILGHLSFDVFVPTRFPPTRVTTTCVISIANSPHPKDGVMLGRHLWIQERAIELIATLDAALAVVRYLACKLDRFVKFL